MSAGSLFDSESEKRPNLKVYSIAVAAFVVLCGLGYGFYWYSSPVPVSGGEIFASEITENTIVLLAQPSFSGDEFRKQLLGKGSIVKYAWREKQVYFTFPETGEAEFQDFLFTYILDSAKIDFGKLENGRIRLDDYKLTISPAASRFFKTTADNVRINPHQGLNFQFSAANYNISLEELRNFSNNSQLYGGKIITQVPA